MLRMRVKKHWKKISPDHRERWVYKSFLWHPWKQSQIKGQKKTWDKNANFYFIFQFKSCGPSSLPTRDRVSLIFNVVVKCMHQLIYYMIYFILGNYFFPSIKCMFQFIFSIIVQAHSASLSLAAQCCDGQAWDTWPLASSADFTQPVYAQQQPAGQTGGLNIQSASMCFKTLPICFEMAELFIKAVNWFWSQS